jgi:dipeptidase E
MKIFLASDFTAQSMEKIDPYLRSIAGQRVLLINTASHGEGFDPDPAQNIAPFSNRGARVIPFDLAGQGEDDVRAQVRAADIIYVAGGNTFYLLEHMNVCGMKGMLTSAWAAHKTYIGSSAGSIVMSPDIGFIAPMDDRAKAQNLQATTGLGLIDFLFLPHVNSPMQAMADAADKIAREYSGHSPMIGLRDADIVYVPDHTKKMNFIL